MLMKMFVPALGLLMRSFPRRNAMSVDQGFGRVGASQSAGLPGGVGTNDFVVDVPVGVS